MELKNLPKILLGSSLEWYDFALYGFFAPIFSALYFPSNNPLTSLLSVFLTFAVGFLARPLGSIVFGRIGDKYGRAKALRHTPLLITIPTILLSILPTYNQIGILAPILLIILRLFQGFFVGAEFGGNMVYLCESEEKNKYFLGSLGSCTGSFGILIASLSASFVYYVFPEEIVFSWGWRFAFMLSVIPGYIGWIMRANLSETSAFSHKKKNALPVSFKEMMSRKNNILICSIVIFFHATSFYFIFMFLPTFLASNPHAGSGKSIIGASSLLAARLFIIPILGKVADQIGGTKMLLISSALFSILSPFLFTNITNDKFMVISITGLALITTLNAASVPGFLFERFPCEIRYTSFSIVFNAGFGLFGGITPLVCTYLASISIKIAPIIYVMASSMLCFATLFALYWENRKREIYGKCQNIVAS